MGEKVEFKDGDFVKFAVGRARTVYEAKVTGRVGQFLVTTDSGGIERKVRPGACSPFVPSNYF